jgi:hypothetical protein
MLIRGSLREQYVKCGKPDCACAQDRDKRHGPYWVLYWREYGRLRRRYVSRDELPAIRAGVENRKAVARQIREWKRKLHALCRVTDMLAGG